MLIFVEQMVKMSRRLLDSEKKILFPKGIKFDEGKKNYLDIFELLDLDFLTEISEVMLKGKEKYGFENWKRDLDERRIKKALLRHLVSYLQGDLIDKESGKSHLSHMTCNIMFLHYYQNKKDTFKSNGGGLKSVV